jgi:hypothetical protein
VSLRPERSGLPSSSNPVEKAGHDGHEGRMCGCQPVRPGSRAVVESNHKEPDDRRGFDSPS